jgi:hypothetical protein
LPDEPPAPALSLLYQASVGIEGAVLQVRVSRHDPSQRTAADLTTSVTYTLPLTTSGWAQFHTPLPSEWGGALDLRIELTQDSGSLSATVRIDEVRLGHSRFKIYLPTVAGLH